jgi:hypothetical protein
MKTVFNMVTSINFLWTDKMCDLWELKV